MVGGFYQYALPAAFYPDYRRHGIGQPSRYAYEFSYEVLIAADGCISGLSIPENAEVIDKNEEKTRVKI